MLDGTQKNVCQLQEFRVDSVVVRERFFRVRRQEPYFSGRYPRILFIPASSPPIDASSKATDRSPVGFEDILVSAFVKDGDDVNRIETPERESRQAYKRVARAVPEMPEPTWLALVGHGDARVVNSDSSLECGLVIQFAKEQIDPVLRGGEEGTVTSFLDSSEMNLVGRSPGSQQQSVCSLAIGRRDVEHAVAGVRVGQLGRQCLVVVDVKVACRSVKEAVERLSQVVLGRRPPNI